MRKLDGRTNLIIEDIVRRKNLKETHIHNVLRRVLLFIPGWKTIVLEQVIIHATKLTNSVTSSIILICDSRSGFSIRSLLTSRELEVLQLLVEAMSTKRTASSLCLGVNIIEFHHNRIMKKAGVNNIADFIKHAIRKGIISL